MNNFNFSLIDIDKFILNGFLATQESKSELEADSLGINLITEFDNLSILTGYSQSKFSLDTSLNGQNISQNQQNNYELGLNFKINNSIDLFYRDNIVSLSDIEASPINFGLSGAEMNSKTLGLMYDNNSDLMIGIGIYQPQQLVSGELSFFKPVGRHPDGTLYYENINYSVEDSDNLPMYLSIYNELNGDLILNMSFKQSHLDQDKISQGTVSLSKQF